MAKFEIFMQEDLQYHFNLKADNGKVILTSEGYKAKDGVRNRIESVRKNASDASAFEILGSEDEQFYFNLKAPNGEIIGTSEMYVTHENAREGIAAVKKAARGAEIEDFTL